MARNNSCWTRKTQVWYMEFRDHLGTRRRVSGLREGKQTAAIGRNVEKLVRCGVSGDPLHPVPAKWVGTLLPKLKKNSIRIGLPDANKASGLHPLLKRVEGKADSDDRATHVGLRQARAGTRQIAKQATEPSKTLAIPGPRKQNAPSRCALERCPSGRRSRFRKPVCDESRTVGSNPTLSVARQGRWAGDSARRGPLRPAVRRGQVSFAWPTAVLRPGRPRRREVCKGSLWNELQTKTSPGAFRKTWLNVLPVGDASPAAGAGFSGS